MVGRNHWPVPMGQSAHLQHCWGSAAQAGCEDPVLLIFVVRGGISFDLQPQADIGIRRLPAWAKSLAFPSRGVCRDSPEGNED